MPNIDKKLTKEDKQISVIFSFNNSKDCSYSDIKFLSIKTPSDAFLSLLAPKPIEERIILYLVICVAIPKNSIDSFEPLSIESHVLRDNILEMIDILKDSKI